MDRGLPVRRAVGLSRSAWFRLLLVAGLLVLVTAVVAIWASSTVWAAGTGRVYDNLAELPERRVALVLGCPPRLPGGRPNLYFERRMSAAARLLHGDKVDYLLVSGDNSVESYNEPRAMYEALLRRGVPGERIVLDFAGFRTLDSVIRALEVFGQEEVIVVSQEFHNRRAVYLADRVGLGVVGYNAADVELGPWNPLRWREAAARVKAVVDVHVLGTGAKFLGEPVTIGGDGNGGAGAFPPPAAAVGATD